jgi:hypothetical protein
MHLNDLPQRRDIFSLAGWLFADLLLGLSILFLVIGMDKIDNLLTKPGISPNETPALSLTSTLFQNKTYNPTRTITITITLIPSLTPYPTSTSYPTYTPYPTLLPTSLIGLDREPAIIYVYKNENLYNKMLQELSNYPNRRAGFVLIFGYNLSPRLGVNLARDVGEKIKDWFPNIFPISMPTRNLYWEPDLTGETGTIRLEIFFINEIKSYP